MRLKQLQADMQAKGIGLVLLFNLDADNIDPNFTYFAQYTGFGVLAITKKKSVLIVPKAEYLRAKKTSKIRIRIAKKKLLDEIRKTVKQKPKRIGIDKNRVTLNLYRRIKKELGGKYIDISPAAFRLRTSKTGEEILIMREGCRITDEIMHSMFWNFKKFKTEADVSAFLINETNKRGFGLSFKPIVASGKNAAEPHHEPDSKPLNKGFCVIDFGIRYRGYCTDITRTCYLGSPTEKEIALYYKVLDAQIRLIAMCEEGKSFIKIHKTAHKLLGKESKHFTHLIGHGVGTEIHESPNPKSTQRRPLTKLMAGAVITIEPGLYYTNKAGIRIEDDILITKHGPELLTKTGKNLLIIRR